jgi:hypothetical protein
MEKSPDRHMLPHFITDFLVSSNAGFPRKAGIHFSQHFICSE